LSVYVIFRSTVQARDWLKQFVDFPGCKCPLFAVIEDAFWEDGFLDFFFLAEGCRMNGEIFDLPPEYKLC
jgi:hypothetical protein